MYSIENVKEVLENTLNRRLPGLKTSWSTSGGDLCLEVPADSLRDVGIVLIEGSDVSYPFLACITGVDHFPADPRFELIYQLRSLSPPGRLVVKTRVAEKSSSVPSLVELWRAADWFEREIYDLFGITFAGHPDMRRLLMPEDWHGYPLRKDYPLEGKGPENS